MHAASVGTNLIACNPSHFEDVNIEEVELLRTIEPQGIRAAASRPRRRQRGLIPVPGSVDQLLVVLLDLCFVSLYLNPTTGSLGLGG